MKFVSYYRVSTSSQGQSGLGLEAQAQCVQDYVARNGGVVLKEFTEIESGKCSTRMELERALRYCTLTKAKLIISKVCRLTRDVHFLTGLQKSGVDFICCDMPDANTMTVQLMTVLAEGEAKNISVRTKEALAAAKARGVKLGNPNLDLVRNVDTNQANVARLAKAESFSMDVAEIIKEIYEEGVTTYRGIARSLNDKNIKTRRGCDWTPMQVSRVLKRLKDTKG